MKWVFMQVTHNCKRIPISAKLYKESKVWKIDTSFYLELLQHILMTPLFPFLMIFKNQQHLDTSIKRFLNKRNLRD